MKNKQIAFLMTALMTIMPLAGCLGAEEMMGEGGEASGLFDFEGDLGGTTWYHYPGGIQCDEQHLQPSVETNIPLLSAMAPTMPLG